LVQTDLVELARANDVASLEEAWNEAASSPGDVSQFRQTIEALCDQDLPGKALALGSQMVEVLASADRIPDARSLAAVVVRRGAHNDKLAQRLFELIGQQDGSQEWYEEIKTLAGISGENVSAVSLTEYEKYRRFTEGHVLYHRAGWGEGVVSEFRAATREIVIDFVNGRQRDMPLQAAIESLTPLPDDDLRCMRILHKEKLETLAEENPSVLIRKAAVIFRGKITSTKVKETLSPSIIPTKKWASFWKKAKAAAAHDPWLQIEGSATRPVFILRKKPVSLADEARREVKYADDLADAIKICRNYIGRCHDENATNTILEVAREVVEAALAKSDPEQNPNGDGAPDPSHLLDGILLLGEHKIETTITPGQELKILLTQDGEFHPENMNKLSTAEAREHAATLLPEALGDEWVEMCAAALPRFPADVVETVIEKIVESGKGDRLVGLWDTVAPYPRRHPMMTYMMGCLFADGTFDAIEGAPDKFTVGRVLLHLVRTLTEDRKGDAVKGRLLTRLVSLLTGRREYLSRILDGISRDDLAAYFGISERGGPDFPQEISNEIVRTVARKFPDLSAKPDKPFWESEFNFVTAEGLARHQEEYRILVEEKIPANSTAIGVAASHGDLSENSEWDAAVEEQRNLTNRAAEMDEELQLARMISDNILPDDTVSPGTRVTFTDITDDEERVIRLLGPFDTSDDAEDILNYKAPLGQALLGMKPGQSTTLEMGGEEHELHVDAVEKL
jgi:transcription elongation GreA/GreB family factor